MKPTQPILTTFTSILFFFAAMVYYAQGSDCATATPAIEGLNTATGPISGAGASNLCGMDGDATNANWYSFSVTTNSTINITSCLEGVDTRLSVYSGDCATLQCIASNDDICEMTVGGDAWASAVTFDADANEPLLIEWDDRWSPDGFNWGLFITSVPDCPSLVYPLDQSTDVPLAGDNLSVPFAWNNNSVDIEENHFLIGSSPDDLENLGSIGGSDLGLQLYNMMYNTTYYWSVVPENDVGEGENCPVFSFTTIAFDETDTDVDGVPDIVDCAPNDINIYESASCDDGDAATYLDEIDQNCICAGFDPIQGQFCQSAISVVEGVYSISQIVNSGGFNSACVDDATAGYWYNYTASGTGLVEVTSNGTDVDTRLSVFNACDALTCLASSDDINPQGNHASRVVFGVVENNEYLIQWDDRWSNEGFNFSIILEENPEDSDSDGIVDIIDNCADISNANQLDLDADNVGDVCDDDLDGDGVLNVDDCSPNDANIFPGQSCDDLDAATFNDVILSDCSCAGSAAEPNFFCGNAAVVDVGNHSTNGPVIGNVASNICFSGATHAVWYVYSATTAGALTISSSMSGVDTRLSVYESCDAEVCFASNDDVSFLEDPGSEVIIPVMAGQDYYIEWDDAWTSSGFDFSLSFEAVDSDGDGVSDTEDNCPFQFNVEQGDADGDGVGDFCDGDIDGDDISNNIDCDPFDASVYPLAPCNDGDPSTSNDLIQADCTCQGTTPPTNSTCAQAKNITEGSFTDSGPYLGSSATNLCESGATSSNWYRYTPSGSGTALISSCQDGVDTRVSVFNNDCNNLACVTSNDDAGCGVGTPYASSLSFTVSLGDVFLLEWDDRWSNEGFNFIILLNPSTTDTDLDGVMDDIDNCYDVANADQADFDEDEVGDACDEDVDGDFVPNASDCQPNNPLIYQGASCDDGNEFTILDTLDENCECVGFGSTADADLDGIVDIEDNCVDVANASQLDLDGDGIGDLCDDDIDGDWVLNPVDCNPTNGFQSSIIGSSCDDGNANTVFDEIIADCICVGAVIPNNINCAAAENVSTGTTQTGIILGFGASDNCGSNGESGLWYSFTAPSSGVVNVNSSNEIGNNTSLTVFDDCDGICLSSNDDIAPPIDLGSSVNLNVVSGETYLIQWDDLWSSSAFTFEISYLIDLCPTDFNDDGKTDGDDFSIFLGNYGIACGLSDCPTDLTGDGVTDGDDFSVFLGNYGLDCPGTN